MNNEIYNRMWKGLKEGLITEGEWRDLVEYVFMKILNENNEVFRRLKYM